MNDDNEPEEEPEIEAIEEEPAPLRVVEGDQDATETNRLRETIVRWVAGLSESASRSLSAHDLGTLEEHIIATYPEVDEVAVQRMASRLEAYAGEYDDAIE